MSEGTRLDRSNRSKVQELAGVPGVTTRGNICLDTAAGDLYVKFGASWILVDSGTADTTLDDAYNNFTGAATVTVDAKDVSWVLNSEYSFVVNIEKCAKTSDGFHVLDSADYFKLNHVKASGMELLASLERATIETSGHIHLLPSALGIGTLNPTAYTDIEYEGTVSDDTALLEVCNSANAASMANTETSIVWKQYYYDAVRPAEEYSGKITVGTAGNWDSSSHSQMSYMAFSVVDDGVFVEVMRILNSGYVGFGTSTPLQKVNVQSGAIRFDYMPTLSAAGCTLSAGAAGICTNGIHSIKLTAVNALGETELGTESMEHTVVAGEQIDVTDLPVSTDPTCTGRWLYMNKAGGATWYRVALLNNVDTSYSINVADASLVTAGPTSNTTAGKFYNGTLLGLAFDSNGSVSLGGNGSVLPAAGYTDICAGSSGYIRLLSTNAGAVFAYVNQYGIGINTTCAIGEAFKANGQGTRTFGMARHNTANTAGNSLSVIAGGATSGATDKDGGPLLLLPGVSTGAGTSYVAISAYPGIAAATTDNTAVEVARFTAIGVYVGPGTTDPTAYLHLKAGTATALTAPLKFTSGVVNTVAEAGAVEFDGSYLYYTDTTPTRWRLATEGTEGIQILNAATLAFNDFAISTIFVSYTATGACTITIDSDQIARAGRKFTVKDTGLNAAANNITLETEGAETIEGEADLIINADGMSITLQSDGTNLWIV